MAYKFNPFTGKLDNTGPEVTALNTLGVKADLATIQAIVGPSVGDVWQADDTDIFYLWDGSSWVSLGTLGTPGPTGATGADGTDGSTILSGSGAPVDNVTGSDGDFYIDTAAHTIYGPRTAGAWGVGTSLVAGGATTLGGLTDVDLTTSPPTNGEALVYDSVNSEWVPGSAGATAAGSANQIQYNDGAGGLAASADLTWDNTAKELGVTGDLNLDDGGSFSTTVQAVTPTANRTISFPDATGTVALVSGANGTIQYNDAGTLNGNSDFTVDPDWNDASTVFTGLKLNVTNTASANGSSTIDLSIGGTSLFKHGYDVLNNANTVTLDSVNLVHINSNGGTIISFYGANNPSQPLIVRTPAGIGLGPIGSQTFLVSEAANVLAQKSFGNSQTFRLYNTTDQTTTNYERTSITRDSSGLVIDAQKGGTGADPTNLLDVKLDGASQLLIGSNGSLLISSNGSATTPKLRTATGALAGYGIYYGATQNGFFYSWNGTATAGFSVDGVQIVSNKVIAWTSSTSAPDGTRDVAIARDSAGVLKVTDGSTGTGYLRQEPIPVGNLPTAAAGNAGTRIFVSDSNVGAAGNFGAVVASGGSNVVPVYSDGGAWRIG